MKKCEHPNLYIFLSTLLRADLRIGTKGPGLINFYPKINFIFANVYMQ